MRIPGPSFVAAASEACAPFTSVAQKISPPSHAGQMSEVGRLRLAWQRRVAWLCSMIGCFNRFQDGWACTNPSP